MPDPLLNNQEDKVQNPYFIVGLDDEAKKMALKHNLSGMGKVIQYFLMTIWPYIKKALDVIVFDTVRFIRAFVKIVLRQVGGK